MVQPRVRGVLLSMTAAVAIGVDPLGTRFLTGEGGCEFWAFYFWRTLVFSTFVMLWRLCMAGTLRNFIAGVRACGRLLPVLSIVMGAVETLMVLGLANTTIAKCLLLFSLNPLGRRPQLPPAQRAAQASDRSGPSPIPRLCGRRFHPASPQH